VDYSVFSAKIGRKLTNEILISDPSDSELSAGGTQTVIIGSFGTGKSTMMATFAEYSDSTNESKLPLMHARMTNDHERLKELRVYPTTVVYRVRDSDIWPVLIPGNWKERYPESFRVPKDLVLFVNEQDAASILFYTVNKAHEPIPIPYMPEVCTYSDALDLVTKLRVGWINAILEPQEYYLSDNLIDYIRVIRSEDRPTDINKPLVPSGKRPVGRPRQKKEPRDYSNVAVKPAVFWFDFISAVRTGFHGKPIQCIFDEADDFISSTSSDTHWWLVYDFAEKYRDLRKNNISTVVSTHSWDMLFYAIPKRASYKIMLPGTVATPKFTMIRKTDIFSQLPSGHYMIEKSFKEFGIDRFSRIPKPIMGKIEGLRGDFKGLTNQKFKEIKKIYESGDNVHPSTYLQKNLPEVIEI